MLSGDRLVDQRRCFAQSFFGDIAEDQKGPFGGKATGYSTPYARASACNQGDFICQTHNQKPLYSTCRSFAALRMTLGLYATGWSFAVLRAGSEWSERLTISGLNAG